MAHSTGQAETYPQVKKRNGLDRCAITLCNIAFYELHGEKHETHISTFRNQKKTHPRLFGANEDTRWARRYQCASRQGSCKARCLAPRSNLPLRIGCCAKMGLIAPCMRKAWQTSTSRYSLSEMAA